MKKPHLADEATFTENNISSSSENKDTLFTAKVIPLVSYFGKVTDQTPKEISISEVFDIIKSDHMLEKSINLIRETTNKTLRADLKRFLPAITVSGTFQNGHKTENLICHSGLLQIDFDDVSSPSDLKEKISKDAFTFACFLSPSGTGIKAIIKILPEFHLESFEALRRYYLKKYAENIDIKCKDKGRLMFLSHDKNIYINPDSMLFETITEEVEKIISQIEAQKFDLTNSYDNWLKFGFAFAHQFNNAGRDYFHRISKFNPNYNEEKTNEQYDKCLNSSSSGVTIKTFFHFAKEANLNIASQKKNTPKIEKSKNEKTHNKTSKFVIVSNYLNENYDFRYNEVANEIECKVKADKNFKSANENNIYVELQRQNIGFSQNNLMALLRSDFVPAFNPIKEYFNSLPIWDEQIDHISNICKFIIAKDQERFNRQFKKMLVRCIACGLEFSFNKQAFILMGGQNGGKTTLCRWLCPPILKSYYTENISTDKDSLITLSENFMINLDELSTLQKFEINQLKSMISKDFIKVRRPYDKKPTVSKRRANFFGSTNREEFLTDETGSVRWLCFELIKIIWDYHKEIDIDSIWSQAYSLFKNGFPFELTADEIAENEAVNSNHQVRTAELELIQAHFEQSEKGKALAEALTATDILIRLKSSGISPSQLNVGSIGKALKLLGLKQVSERVGENKIPKKIYWLQCNLPIEPTTLTTKY